MAEGGKLERQESRIDCGSIAGACHRLNREKKG